ncbi:Crp/Fnr family transcriptional regulator [Pedobacter psychrodurus]|nr:Crp/Fnr family transcriptional regulator [Pedobacter psychrodurus]
MITKAFRPKKMRKRQYLLQEGNVSKYTGFIIKGAMRQYYIDEKGLEHVVYLFIENYWATDRESFYNLTPSIYNIEASENTELLIITRAELVELMKKIPALVEMIRVMDDRNAIAMQKRISANISNTAEERYEEFIKNYPHFAQRFPQHQIASFLGIAKETLSRIKRKPSR